MKAAIPFSSLSITFQHAVLITLMLNCKYIWIDSLCIMQDSKEDWKSEASAMKDVYANGLLNLAAASPNSLRKGLSFEHSTNARPFCIKLNAAGGPLAQESIYEVRNDSYWMNLVEKTPLNQRAWVLQERVLSPRVLYFTPTELAWECGETIATETFPTGLPGAMEGSYLPKHSLPRSSAEASQSPPHIHLSHWAEIVMAYSTCGLSEVSDKLVALSSVASLF